MPPPASEEGRDRAIRLLRYAETHEARWFWETDAEGRLTYLTDSVAQTLEAFGIDAVGARLSDVFVFDQDDRERARSLNFHLVSRTPFSGYAVRGRKGLSESLWSISGQPWIEPNGTFRGFVGSGADLTQLRSHEDEIKRLALADSLTGLANRQRMQNAMDQMLGRSADEGKPITLLLLDLDRFKAVNDTLGHPTGDALLKQVAKRILEVVGERGIVGRLGGDEFEIILPLETARERIDYLASAIISSLSEPYMIGGHKITIGCSLGIAIAPEHGRDTETLVRNADLALYSAKEGGRADFRYFAPELLETATRRKQLEDDLRAAMTNGQLYLAYQPAISTETEECVGFEALLRWEHPARGSIPPADFIPVAEDAGLIETLGDWVLRTATSDLARLPGRVRVAVNVSPIQFANPGFPAKVMSAIAEAQVDPGRLELELTESVFLGDEAASDQMFKALKNIGVRLALDDFGTGYSSLAYLKSAPFDKIKIDQSFVRGAIESGNRNAAIIKAIVSLADTLGMETTAEGVEHQDELPLIRQLGCSQIQGFVYGKAMRLEDVKTFLKANRGKTRAIGFKVSRPERSKVLRFARIRANGAEMEVIVRDLSRSGLMIECDQQGLGEDVADIEIAVMENCWMPGRVCWRSDTRMGVQLQNLLQDSDLNELSL